MRAAAALVTLATLLLVLPQPIAATKQVGVVSHVADLPAGLFAEGLATTEDHLYVGTLSFSSPQGTILVFDEDGAPDGAFTVPGFPFVGQVAFHDEDLFAVACNAFAPSATGAVVRIDQETGVVSTVATEPTCPNGLAIDRHGNMFVTNIFDGSVSKVTPSGTVSTFASGGLLAAGPVDGFTLGPNDIAFNKAGTALFVSNAGKNTVVKIDVNNDGTAGAVTTFATGIPAPDGLAFDQKGNLYVCSPFTNSVWVVTPAGAAAPAPFDTSKESLNNPSNVAFLGHRLFISNLALFTPGVLSKISVVRVQSPGLQDDS